MNVDDVKKPISPPPKYVFTANDRAILPPPSSTPARGRGRGRAGSPGKATPAKVASPRKRVTKAVKEANAAAARQASENLQATLDSAASIADSESVEPPSVNGEKPTEESDKVTVNVDSTVEVNGDTETTHTQVQVKMPADSAELPLPETTEEMIATAKEMVEEAQKLEGESSKSGSGKRKAEVLEADEEGDEKTGREAQPAKKAKVMEQEIMKQKVRNRAIFGVAATLAIGYDPPPAHFTASNDLQSDHSICNLSMMSMNSAVRGLGGWGHFRGGLSRATEALWCRP